MSKNQNKTVENDGDVRAFIESVENDQRREDAFVVLDLMSEVTGETPKMWGTSIIGFGNYHYKYDSGREGDFMKLGFSPRKQNLALYVMPGVNHFPEILESLGKYKTGKSCLYINKLKDVDMEVLKKLIQTSYSHMTEKYG